MQLSGDKTLFSAKIGIWLLMLTVTILFGTLSLAFLLLPAGEVPEITWRIPPIFYYNTILLFVSSIGLHLLWQDQEKKHVVSGLWGVIALGLLFLGGQVWGWLQLISSGLGIDTPSPKVSFLYVLTGVHALHLVGGLIFLVYIAVQYAYKGKRNFELALYFWHFLGALWVYLLLILALN